MQQLFPPTGDAEVTIDAGGTESDVDVMAAVGRERRSPFPHRPWIYTNMIVSADGATAVAGVSGDLGGDGDRAMFRALRSQADAIVVGAGTVRAERYRPPRAYDEAADQRRARGQRPRPRLVVVTGSLNLDPSLPLFADTNDNRPLVVTTRESLDRDDSGVAERADIIVAGAAEVDLVQAMAELKKSGVGRVLCEGGPGLNGDMVAAGLIDEWNLTIAPLLVGGDSPRAAVGPLPGGPPEGMALDRVWQHDHYLFCRWVRTRGDRPGAGDGSDDAAGDQVGSHLENERARSRD